MSTSGNWAPRALKKSDGSWRRGTEFNVEQPAAAAQAKPDAAAVLKNPVTAFLFKEEPGKGGKAARALPKWGDGAADLDDLTEEAPAAKKPRQPDVPAAAAPHPAAAATSSAAASSSSAPPAGGADGVDEIIAAAPRLAQHIASSKKFNKVAAMVYSLFESGRVTKDNASAAFSVLLAGVADPRACRTRELKVAYRRLYSAALSREALFGAEERATLEVWRLRVLTQMDLVTDDTYQFAAAVRAVKARLEKLPCIYAALEPEGARHLPVEERPRWLDGLFDCVDAAVEQHKFPWARTSVDLLVKAAVERRQNFTPAQQEEIQRWNALCKGQKILRQQQAASEKSNKDLTSYERKEQEWMAADISTSGGGGESGGGGDNWHASN